MDEGRREDKLYRDDLRHLFELLNEMSTKWWYLGIQLGISPPKLKKIEHQYSRDSSKCLSELLFLWLSEDGHGDCDPPTRSALVEALKKDSVGEHVLAKKVEELNLSGMKSSSSSSSQAHNTPMHVTACEKACTLGPSKEHHNSCATVTADDGPQKTSSTSSEDVPSRIDPPSACAANYSPTLRSPTSDSSVFSTSDIQSVYKAPIRTRSDSEGKTDGQNSVSGEYTFPCLDTHKLSESDRDQLIARLQEDFRKLSFEFARLTSALRASLVESKVTPAMVAGCLMDLNPASLRCKSKDSKLIHHYDAIKVSQDIDTAFEILRDYYSFFDFDIIEFLIQAFVCNGEVRRRLVAYKISFEDYCRRNVFECPIYTQKNSNSTDIVVKLEENADLDHFTMSTLKRLQVRLSDILGIQNRDLRVCGVEKGCVEITLQIPAAFEKIIFPLSPEQEKQLLLYTKCISLKCGKYHYSTSKNFQKDAEYDVTLKYLESKHLTQTKQNKPQLRQMVPTVVHRTHHTRKDKLNKCVNYMLLGGCSRGEGCWYSHDYQIPSPAQATVHSMSITHWIQRTKGYSPDGKGYVIRIPRGKHSTVTIVAENPETVEFAALHVLHARRDQIVLQTPQTQTTPRRSFRKHMCMRYQLTGSCESEACQYSHDGLPLQKKAEAFLHLPRELPAGYHASLGVQRRNPTSGKFYILLTSKRDPDITREIKVVAEDEDTVQFVRENIFNCLEIKAKRTAPIPGTTHIKRKPCPRLKLLGKCNRLYKCEWYHTSGQGATSGWSRSDTFETKGNFARYIAGCVGHGPDDGCYVIVATHEKTKVDIIAETEKTLEYVKRELTAKMGEKDTTPHTGYNYIHPDGVSERNLTLSFAKRDGDHELYQLVSRISSGDKIVKKEISVKEFEHLNPNDIPTVYSRLVNLQRKTSPHPRSVQLMRGYRNDIHDRLRDGLTYMCENGLYAKLEGRFGKVLWKYCMKDKTIDVERFINWALKESKCRQCSFDTGIAGKYPAALKRSCIREIGFSDETYNFNLQTKKDNGKINIRVQFKDGKPKVVLVKRSEYKVVIFDIICVNRENDIRVSLHAFEPGSVEDPRVKAFISTLKMPQTDTISFAPQAPDGEWTVTHIRHKKWEGFYFRDYKYVVTVSTVGSYGIQGRDLRQNEVVLESKDYGIKHEVELHNVIWECVFTSKLGLTSEQNTFLHLNKSILPTQDIPVEWTPEMIMNDFEKDGFLQMMDDLNKAMELVSIA